MEKNVVRRNRRKYLDLPAREPRQRRTAATSALSTLGVTSTNKSDKEAIEDKIKEVDERIR